MRINLILVFIHLSDLKTKSPLYLFSHMCLSHSDHCDGQSPGVQEGHGLVGSRHPTDLLHAQGCTVHHR